MAKLGSSVPVDWAGAPNDDGVSSGGADQHGDA